MKKFLTLSFVVLPLVACSDDDTTVPANDTGADTTTDAGEDTTTDAPVDAPADTTADTAVDTAEEDVEIDFTPDPSCEADWVVVVNGDVVEEDGTPVAGAKSQLCVRIGSPDGNLICLRPEDSDDNGEFSILAPESARCVGGGSMRVFVPVSDLATTYCHIDTENDGGTLDLADDIVLFGTDAVADLPEYGDPTVPRAVTFPGGLEIAEFVPDDLGFTFGEEAYANLGARRVDPNADGLCFVDTELDGLWAFRVEANSESGFDFRFPNDDGYEAGATVNLFVLGGLETKLDDGTQVEETVFEQYGTATVSEDGAWVEGRIPAFTWLGYALAE